MPVPRNQTSRDFSQYDAMPDEQLRQLLRTDASKQEGEDTDMELLLHIMEVLAQRRKDANTAIPPEQALESFKKNYLNKNDPFISKEWPESHKPKGILRWKSWLAAAAAVVVLVFCGSFAARSYDIDVFEIIAKRTKETFHFGSAGQTDDPEVQGPRTELPYADLQAALTEYGITLSIVPNQLPNGYIETEVRVIESPKQRFVTAKYENGENSIRFRVADYLENYPGQIEQSDTLLERYPHNGIEFYIFENYDQLRAVWIHEHCECYIMGPLTLEEIKEIIDSIGKG